MERRNRAVLAIVAIIAAGGTVGVLMKGDRSDSPDARVPIDVASLGPQVGERVPDFSLPDQAGQVRTLQSIMGSRGAMLLFHRSADW